MQLHLLSLCSKLLYYVWVQIVSLSGLTMLDALFMLRNLHRLTIVCLSCMALKRWLLCSAKGLQDTAVDVTIAAPYLSELHSSDLYNLLLPATK